ncbi:hypothetical protein M0802_010868 [Mischocyttarus mexicanus]|nr:hypothetical protein M0802_010868 [Mischocyttarus mexicanus]
MAVARGVYESTKADYRPLIRIGVRLKANFYTARTSTHLGSVVQTFIPTSMEKRNTHGSTPVLQHNDDNDNDNDNDNDEDSFQSSIRVSHNSPKLIHLTSKHLRSYMIPRS